MRSTEIYVLSVLGDIRGIVIIFGRDFRYTIEILNIEKINRIEYILQWFYSIQTMKRNIHNK